MEVANNDVPTGADTINAVATEVTELTQVTVGSALVRIAWFYNEFCNL